MSTRRRVIIFPLTFWSLIICLFLSAKSARILRGPIVDAFQSPFLYVIGTISPDPVENRVIENTVRIVEAFWRRRDNRTVEVKKDIDITEEDIKTKNLLLYGNPRSNKILKEIYKQLPILIEENAIIAGNKKYTGEDVGVIMIHPNPLNPEKYVVVYAGLTYKGIKNINQVPASGTDYVIFNEKSKWHKYGRPVLEQGFFDKSDPIRWKYIPPQPQLHFTSPTIKEESTY